MRCNVILSNFAMTRSCSCTSILRTLLFNVSRNCAVGEGFLVMHIPTKLLQRCRTGSRSVFFNSTTVIYLCPKHIWQLMSLSSC